VAGLDPAMQLSREKVNLAAAAHPNPFAFRKWCGQESQWRMY